MKAQTIAPEALIPGRAGPPSAVSPRRPDGAFDVAPAFRPAPGDPAPGGSALHCPTNYATRHPYNGTLPGRSRWWSALTRE